MLRKVREAKNVAMADRKRQSRSAKQRGVRIPSGRALSACAGSALPAASTPLTSDLTTPVESPAIDSESKKERTWLGYWGIPV